MAAERAPTPLGDSMTHTHAANENRLAFRIFAAILVFVLLLAAVVITFGLPALGIIGVVATVAVFVALLTITAGN